MLMYGIYGIKIHQMSIIELSFSQLLINVLIILIMLRNVYIFLMDDSFQFIFVSEITLHVLAFLIHIPILYVP